MIKKFFKNKKKNPNTKEIKKEEEIMIKDRDDSLFENNEEKKEREEIYSFSDDNYIQNNQNNILKIESSNFEWAILSV